MSHAPFETPFAHSVVDAKYMRPHGETHWHQTADRAVNHPMAALTALTGNDYSDETEQLRTLVRNRHFMPGGRYLYASGNDFHQVQNCLLLRCEDSREGWADLGWKAEMSLLTGAGIGVYWGDVRARGSRVGRTGGIASGPIPKAVATNEQGRAAVQGGDRRAAIWGGLLWSHGDIFDWIVAKDWPQYLKDQKAIDPSTPAPLDMTNISVCLDDDFFLAFNGGVDHAIAGSVHAPDGGTWESWAQRVYWKVIDMMTTTGEPGFSVDLGDQREEKLRNACTEIVSADDSDICNLGGISLARFATPAVFGKAVRLGALYLTAGTVYSDLPYAAVAETREKNRRLGLDLMGVHEFLLMRGLKYGTDDGFEALRPFMEEYERALEYAHDYQDAAGLSRSVAATSGAPTGTRAIGAETTTGWEPVTYTAYRRDVITSKAHVADERTSHFVVDPTVDRLLRSGYILPTDDIEDSSTLAHDIKRRLEMQAFAQSYTDQAISMTLNLPHVMTDARERRDFGNLLVQYLPKLRGITAYPDGAIAGQPITRVPLAEAMGFDFSVEESEEKCASGVCGL